MLYLWIFKSMDECAMENNVILLFLRIRSSSTFFSSWCPYNTMIGFLLGEYFGGGGGVRFAQQHAACLSFTCLT